MQTNHFGNDPRGVSPHTEIQIEAWQALNDDLLNLENLIKLHVSTINRTHHSKPNEEYLESMFQNLRDAYHNDLTDLENRIGR